MKQNKVTNTVSISNEVFEILINRYFVTIHMNRDMVSYILKLLQNTVNQIQAIKLLSSRKALKRVRRYFPNIDQ